MNRFNYVLLLFHLAVVVILFVALFVSYFTGSFWYSLFLPIGANFVAMGMNINKILQEQKKKEKHDQQKKEE
jgi:polyferredoxin